jgi:hypothetical protein
MIDTGISARIRGKQQALLKRDSNTISQGPGPLRGWLRRYTTTAKTRPPRRQRLVAAEGKTSPRY